MGRLALSRFQWLLVVLFLLLAGAHAWVGNDRIQPGRVFLPEMWFTPAARPEAGHPQLPDGMVQQAAPAGAIPRQLVPVQVPASVEAEAGSPVELVNPFAGQEDPAALGKQLFAAFCTPCHGGRGQSDGQVVARGFPAPPQLTADPAKQLSDAAIFQILSDGRNNMPPYRFQLTRDERWRVIGYVRSLQSDGPGTQLEQTGGRQP